jgi:hypothetical protein
MSKQAPPAAPHPSENNDSVPRSGSGADSALLAMLKKRQMRASAEPQPPNAPAKKTADE